MASFSEADARATLTGFAAGAVGSLLPNSDEWQRWSWIARFERVVPLLFHLVDQVPTDLNDSQRAELRQMQGYAMSNVVRLEHHLLDVGRRLESAGVSYAVLKGVATAHLDYPDPTWRQFGDVDVLVRPSEFRRACAVLTETGWVQGYPLPVGHEKFTHATTFVRDGLEFDLHQRIAHRALGELISSDALIESRAEFEIAGRSMWALDSRARLIHAAIHVLTSRGATRRLSSAADVAMLTTRAEPQHVLALADTWSVGSLVSRSIEDTFAVARRPVPERWAAAMATRSGRRSRLVDWAYLGDGRRPLVEELAYLRELGRWSHRAQYIRGHLLGADASAEGRLRKLPRRVKYLWSKVQGQ